ncbi:MAG: thioredoxin-disulfide reductase [Actinomycetota bacterium]|nr:thioredoxin-disulfide reductase [Actinomycetota bacterium]
METRDVVILGSGPAGLTAAVYTARADLRPLVIEGEPSSTSDQPGGQLMLTTEVENFPGFPDGVQGPELMEAIRGQAKRFGADLVTTRATRVDLASWPFRVWTAQGGDAEPAVETKALIVATGAQSLMLGLPNEGRLLGYGVSTCATCDGFFFRDQDIAVVGGGDSAVEEALFLTKFARTVTIIHRRDALRASKIMQDRAFANDRVKMRWNAVVEDVIGDNKVTGVRVRDTTDGSEEVLPVTGLFVAIGHEPNSGLFTGQLDLDAAGYIQTAGSSATNVAGVFACGDVQDHVYRQAITAAGSGCMAAIDVERWLDHRAHAG